MNHVVKVRKEFIDILKATTDVEGSVRVLQIIKNNQLYYKLIKKVKACTKFPFVLNTSFNENKK